MACKGKILPTSVVPCGALGAVIKLDMENHS